jgi:peptide/nickel transport system ATP-binding protein
MASAPFPLSPAGRGAGGEGNSGRLLEIRGLKTHFHTDDGWLHAVDGVDLTVDRGETVSVVGESGCGKSVTAMSVLKLLPMPPGRIVAGEILWQGRDLVPLTADAMRAIRAREIAIVFQEPMTSLNPVYTVGEQIAEVVRLHEKLPRRAAIERAVEMLKLVHIPTPERRVHDFPHQFSGGMRQRVMIAMALSCNPKLLIADEPTTALDVTIQAQILELLGELKAKFGMAIMLITHAMGVVAETAQRVVVMYAGKVIEEAPVKELFGNPRHPYTQGLIRSIPRIDTAATRKVRLEAIRGVVPRLVAPAEGCRFAPRCNYARPECGAATPPLREVVPGHKVACILDKAGA